MPDFLKWLAWWVAPLAVGVLSGNMWLGIALAAFLDSISNGALLGRQ